jgi:hypothetical protein
MEEQMLFSPREFLLATRDAGYRGLAAAIAELIDNSIQAGATRIAVLIKSSDPGEKSPTITVSDDGHGMSRHTLRAALRFGWSSRFNDRSGPGRFGMGLPNASLSHARRVEVFTRRRDEPLMWTWLDLDQEPVLGEPAAAETNSRIVRYQHGTAVIWKKCDRLDLSRKDALIADLAHELGRLFRFYIWDGLVLFLNDKRIKPVDALMLRAVQNFAAEKGKQYGPALKFTVANEADGTLGRIRIRFSELPINAWSALPNAKKQELGLLDNPGISIVRSRREIDRGWHFMGKKRRQNYDNWWRCELCFDPALDELFGVTHTKQGINPTRLLRQVLTPVVEKVARELSTRARAVFAAQSAKRTAATRVAEKKEILLEPPMRSRSALQKYRKIGSSDRSLRLRFCVENRAAENVHFFNVRFSAGELVVSLNADHAFYERFYSRLREQRIAPTRAVLKYIEIMILAAARAESLLGRGPRQGQSSRFRELWSRILSTYLA